MKRIFKILNILLIIVALAVPVFANSAQLYWEGAPFFSVCALDEDTPISVGLETLTFDLRSAGWNGVGQATASYEMVNPTESVVSSSMVFPVITSFSEFDPSSVSVTADGADVEYQLYIGDRIEEAGNFSLSDYTCDIETEVVGVDDYLTEFVYGEDATIPYHGRSLRNHYYK